MRKRGLISVLILSLLLSSIIPHKIQAVTEQAKTAKISDNYVEGEAIVTLNASFKTGLAKEGTASFDSDIEVKNSWDFGPAKKKKGKNLYLSEVRSDTYSTKELIEKLNRQDNVVAAEPNYYRYKLATTNDTYADEQWYLDAPEPIRLLPPVFSTKTGFKQVTTAIPLLPSLIPVLTTPTKI